MKIETLHENEWISLKKMKCPEKNIFGYVYSHESRCNGQIVSFLPFKKVRKTFFDEYQFLIRCECTPCWELKQTESSFTGGIDEGLSSEDCVLNELYEEAGILATYDSLINLGRSFSIKSCDSLYHLFAVDVTGFMENKLSHFESELEKTSFNKWISEDSFRKIQFKDPFLSVLYLRFKQYLEGEN